MKDTTMDFITSLGLFTFFTCIVPLAFFIDNMIPKIIGILMWIFLISFLSGLFTDERERKRKVKKTKDELFDLMGQFENKMAVEEDR